MNRLVFFVFCLFVLPLSLGNFATAQETTTETSGLSVRQQDRIRNLAANMSNKIEAANDRLISILLRLNDRKNTLKENGFNVSKASSELGLANDSLVKQRADFQNIDALTEAFVTSNDPRTGWADIKPLFLTSKNELGEAYTHLLNALEFLKSAEVLTVPNTDGTSTTTQNSNSTSTDVNS